MSNLESVIFKFSSKKNLLINITCHKARDKTYKAQILTVVAEKLEPAILNATLSNKYHLGPLKNHVDIIGGRGVAKCPYYNISIIK